jgi:hypothetical protein
MRIPAPARLCVGWTYGAALGGAIAAALLLGGALWVKSSKPPAVVLVSGNDDPKVVLPGVIPDALARDFARDFAATLENYTPATVAKNLAFLASRVAPAGFHEFARLSENLQKLVKESRQSSQLLADDPAEARIFRDGRRIEVVLAGVRRIFVEGALLAEARVTYHIAIVPGEPSRENPTGLLVEGFAAKLEERGKAHGKEKP